MTDTQQRLRGYFITGSDTGVGKTWIGCQLISQLRQQYASLKVRKPVESGCATDDRGILMPADGLALFEANAKAESLERVTPFRFPAAVAPDRAARLLGQAISLEQLQDAVIRNLQPDDVVMVEGAGGFYSPLAEDGLNADLAKRLGLDVIIVVAERLGAINQALLTIKAVESSGLKVHCVILNQCDGSTDPDTDNLQDLSARTDHPVYLCSYQGRLATIGL